MPLLYGRSDPLKCHWETGKAGENDETRSQKTCFDCISVLRVTAKEMCRKRTIQELIIPVKGILFLDRYLPPVGGFFISQESVFCEIKKAGMIPAERKPV